MTVQLSTRDRVVPFRAHRLAVWFSNEQDGGGDLSFFRRFFEQHHVGNPTDPADLEALGERTLAQLDLLVQGWTHRRKRDVTD